VAGLGCCFAAAAETGVVDGTILVSVKFHGGALVRFRGCCPGGRMERIDELAGFLGGWLARLCYVKTIEQHRTAQAGKLWIQERFFRR
jgi:hypothetical protein